VVYSYTEAYKNFELRDKMNEVNSLRTKFVELWANRFDDETVSEPSPEPLQSSQVPYDELVNPTPLMTSHESLETIAEEAEDFLNDRDIELTSHSYENIIAQAQQHGFLV
jgi:hypothetical protein